MKEIHGLGAFGIAPFMSDDLLKQAKYANIKSRAGKMAYLAALGERAPKPEIRAGVHEAGGALKWIADQLSKEEKSDEE
ncbi:MAG: hypothetical protein WC632_07110 [Candidatus Margulisiibacteriota bacterium]